MPNTRLANITGLRFAEQESDISTPASGFSEVFFKADGLYIINDSDEATKLVVNTPTSTEQNTIESVGDFTNLTLLAQASNNTPNLDMQNAAGNPTFMVENEGDVWFGNDTDFSPVITFRTPSGENHFLFWQTNGNNRWDISTTGAEGGGDAGTDLKLKSYNDAGSSLDNDVLYIKRSNSRISQGNTSPQARLHIDGSADEVQFRVDSHSTQTSDVVQLGDFDAGNYVKILDNGGLCFVGTAGIPGAGISAYDVNATVSISDTGIGNKVQITVFDTNDPSNNMTPDHTNDHITCIVAGVYMCIVSISIDSLTGSNAKYGFGIFKNNGAALFENNHSHRDLIGGAGGHAGAVVMAGRITLALNDTIEAWVWNETNTQNIIVDDITLSLDMVQG